MGYQDTLPAGSLINREYQIVRTLGIGGFANTYLARDLVLRRDVAIKEYYPRDLATRSNGLNVSVKTSEYSKGFQWGLKRFTREAQILARFRHPNVVRVFRVIETNDTAYIVLEYVDGADMEIWLKRRMQRPSQAEIDALLPGILSGLDCVHREKVFHRDIKPPNIYIRASDGAPVLLDFGAAKLDFGERAGTTAAIVSRGYSAQESYAADASMQGPWTDIYGLAATLYFAITGGPPPEATERVMRDDIIPAAQMALPGFRPGFLAAIDWGLRVQPRLRPQSIAQWAPALFDGAPTPGAHPAERFQSPVRSNRSVPTSASHPGRFPDVSSPISASHRHSGPAPKFTSFVQTAVPESAARTRSGRSGPSSGSMSHPFSFPQSLPLHGPPTHRTSGAIVTPRKSRWHLVAAILAAFVGTVGVVYAAAGLGGVRPPLWPFSPQSEVERGRDPRHDTSSWYFSRSPSGGGGSWSPFSTEPPSSGASRNSTRRPSDAVRSGEAVSPSRSAPTSSRRSNQEPFIHIPQ